MPNEITNFATILVSDMGNVVVGDILYATGGRRGMGNLQGELLVMKYIVAENEVI